VQDIAGIIAPCLLTLAVASPKVAKASTISVAVAGIIAGVIALSMDFNARSIFSHKSITS
jgi:hypothetical protein